MYFFCHILRVARGGVFDPTFEKEFDRLSFEVQDELLVYTKVLEVCGPTWGRPWVDTLSGTHHANLKDLGFDADDEVWGVAFAFGRKRHAVLLVAGNKSGMSEKRFYRQLVKKADSRLGAHEARLSGERRPQ